PRGRVVREEEPGLDKARLCGIRETEGELIVFVDDDNVLAPDFLEAAKHIAAQYSVLRAWGAGVIEPEFEEEPQKHIVPFTELLALRRVSVPHWSNYKEVRNTPWGAGMVVRRAQVEHFASLLDNSPMKQFVDFIEEKER